MNIKDAPSTFADILSDINPLIESDQKFKNLAQFI